jgi:hypothetical protein
MPPPCMVQFLWYNFDLSILVRPAFYQKKYEDEQNNLVRTTPVSLELRV